MTSTATVWIIDLALAPRRLAACAGPLDPEERARAARFLRAEDRARYTVSHAALRAILGQVLGRRPAEIRLAAGPSGKPVLADRPAGAPDFNLSHSGSCALVGLADAPVGVDVEAFRPLPDALRIARAHFAADEAGALAALPPRDSEAAFFALWTRKEAVVKALGAGLSVPLASFSVSVPPAPPRVLRAADGGAWTLAEIDVGRAAAATVAVRAPDAAVGVRRLADDWPDHL